MTATPDAPDGFRGVFRTDQAARDVYSEAAGIAQVIPRAVAVPVDIDDVQLLVRWAAATATPLIPRGSGSSMAGGAVGDGVIVDLSRFREMGAVDVAHRTIRCGPGVLRDEVHAAARAHGLAFPVDPSSGAYCTVGGMSSTNSAGAHTLKYGAMRRWVIALDCVFADGSRAEIRRGEAAPEWLRTELERLAEEERAHPSRHRGVRKESSGYGLADYAASGDLVDLLVGSEGTLVLVVGLQLSLTPVLPHTASLLGGFARLEDAVTAATRARELGASACELLDRTFLDVARQGNAKVPVAVASESALMVEVEGDSREEADAMARAVEHAFRSAGAIDVLLALDADTEHSLWELRHAASPILSRLDPSLKSMQFIEDGCVPPERLAEYVRGVRAALDRQGIRGVIFGHAGDAHMHVNPLIDVSAPDWRERAAALLAEVTQLVASLGGTVSGEHGDGRLRAPLLPQVWKDASLVRFARVKALFDPQGILNPGAKVMTAGEHAIDRVKYDPSLPPLVPTARAALAVVESERAYARSRLELIG